MHLSRYATASPLKSRADSSLDPRRCIARGKQPAG